MLLRTILLILCYFLYVVSWVWVSHVSQVDLCENKEQEPRIGEARRDRVTRWVPGNLTPESSIRVQIWVCCPAYKLIHNVWTDPKSLNPWPVICHHTITVLQWKPCLMRNGGNIITCEEFHKDRIPLCCLTGVPDVIVDLMLCAADQYYSRSRRACGNSPFIPPFPSQGWLAHPPQTLNLLCRQGWLCTSGPSTCTTPVLGLQLCVTIPSL